MEYVSPDKVFSPRENVKGIKVIYEGAEDGFSLAIINWNGNECLGIRWNVSNREFDDPKKLAGIKKCIGNPASHGYPTWFILPEEFLAPNANVKRALEIAFEQMKIGIQ